MGRTIAEAIFGPMGSPEAIYASEVAGQREVVDSEWLPVECNNCTREDIEALGVVYGAEPVGPVGLFAKVILPDGWKRVATDHDMWSKVVDETGRKRLSVFYKAAFYDQRAFVDPDESEEVV